MQMFQCLVDPTIFEKGGAERFPGKGTLRITLGQLLCGFFGLSQAPGIIKTHKTLDLVTWHSQVRMALCPLG